VHTAGQHGLNGNHSGSVLMAPGMHAFEVDYSQVEPLLLCDACQHLLLQNGLVPMASHEWLTDVT